MQLETGQIKQKLRTLETYLPEEPNAVRILCKYIADTLPETIDPYSFVESAMDAVYSLSFGMPIGHLPDIAPPADLRNPPEGVYKTLEGRIPYICDAIFPAEFSKEAKDFYFRLRRNIS